MLIALVVAGLVAGATGSWSPCGFSMIDTLGAGGRRTVALACCAFALGAPVGGAITCGGLALLGSALQGGGRALAVAAAIALSAAVLEAAGVRIVPQIRRQVPESWRRVLPLPVAGFLYGVLLGMGCTTYVLSFAVPALAGVSTALGDPTLGLALGVAFGIGRALPIVALAPFARAELGARAVTLMAERPGLLRGARAADAVALLACAAVLAPGVARAADFVAANATDPSVAGGALAWQVPGGPGRLLAPGGATQDLAGGHPALGAGGLAYTTPEGITLFRPDGSQRTVGAPGADALAVSDRWLVWRMPAPDRLDALDLTDPAAVPRTLERVPSPATISRPSLDGTMLVYAVAGRRGSTIRLRDLATGGKPTVVRSGARVLLDNPSLAGGALLYVRASARHQELLLGSPAPGGRDRTLLRYRFTTGRDAGHQAGYSHQGRLPEDKRERGFHSGKTPKEKNAVWNNLNSKAPMILIGVHLPILLPIPNLGLIVIDEEHEVGYQEKKHPKINSKEAAIIRAQIANIPILLGSATPSLQTLHNVKTKKWAFFQLKKRFSGTLPTVKVVSLTENKNRKQFWISKELEAAIKDRLTKNEQTIIFINRRGFSFFVQCKECTFIFTCTDCSVSLTLHENGPSFAKSFGGHGRLVCHYCGIHQVLPPACPECKSNADNFIKKGIGTQQVVTLLQKMFPQANIARADLDTSTKKKVWQQTITDMMENKINILVGTQTITKGFHFPHVTLVGVLWADLQLSFPIYNASETALQQLIQVSGRAGRNHEQSMVIIQAMADHELFKHLDEIHYLQFYAAEMEIRNELQYPPIARLAELELKHVNEQKLEQDAYHIVDSFYAYAKHHELDVTILGPAKPPVSKIKAVHSRKIYIKGADFADIVKLYKVIDKKKYSSSIYFTPNPLS